MNKNELLDNLDRLGFSLMGAKGEVDINKTLEEVVRTQDLRLWEGFPIILAKVSSERTVDLKQLQQQMPVDDQEIFWQLVLLSLAIYQYLKLSFSWSNRLKKDLSNDDLERLAYYKKCFKMNDDIVVGNKRLSPERLTNLFNNYWGQESSKSKQVLDKLEEQSLEFALSQLFSPQQKDLIRKKLRGDLLTKTEREYYSRTVKKKVSAIANPDLQRIAQKLMGY
jgi:hypothetical protein